MNHPRVSVLIDTYNHAAFIEQAVESVLAQEFPAEQMEILIVDDGSTDDTPARVEKYKDRVRYLRKENGGQASAFNFGIPQTRGEIIAFLDGDDWWAPTKLRTVVPLLEARPEIGIVGHGYFEEFGAPANRRIVVPCQDILLNLHDDSAARLYRLHKSFLGASKVAIRGELCKRILPLPEALVVEADEYLFTLAVALSQGLVLSQPLFHYRFHDNNLFQFQRPTTQNVRRKRRMLECLARELPPTLRRSGIPESVIALLIEPLIVEATCARLSLDGGWPWETFQTERALARLNYRKLGWRYAAFKAAILGLALFLPPRLFYRLKQAYSGSELRKLRASLGEPVQAAAVRTIQHSQAK